MIAIEWLFLSSSILYSTLTVVIAKKTNRSKFFFFENFCSNFVTTNVSTLNYYFSLLSQEVLISKNDNPGQLYNHKSYTTHTVVTTATSFYNDYTIAIESMH